MPEPPHLLSIGDHSRDSVRMTYVYPVVSRRAGGVSVGVNLNPNNACNWRCVYCQVPGLVRGGPPAIDLPRLEEELAAMLDDIISGTFLQERVPVGQRRLIDVAFSGNGEPTSSAEFPEAVRTAVAVMKRRALLPGVKLRLITNGSLVGRRAVREGLMLLGAAGGEVWFKVDAVTEAGMARVNGVRSRPETVERRLRECAALCPTWVQTCLFALDGQPPSGGDLTALNDFLLRCGNVIRGVHLYGLARPSAQTEASRLSALPAADLETIADRMRTSGLTVVVSP